MPKKSIRLVIWNCNQAFHKKHGRMIEELRPDIAVISECAHPDILRKRGLAVDPSAVCWSGENLQKGIGIFGFGNYKVGRLLTPTPPPKWLLPAAVEGPIDFTLVGLWARYHEAKRIGAPGPVLDFIAYNREWIRNAAPLLAGDFTHPWDVI